MISTHKKGDIVEIFSRDGISLGKAKLIKNLHQENNDGLELWEIQFDNEVATRERWI